MVTARRVLQPHLGGSLPWQRARRGDGFHGNGDSPEVGDIFYGRERTHLVARGLKECTFSLL